MTLSDFNPLARIALRIAAGFLIGQGVAEDDAAFLYSEEMVGLVLLLVSEGWYLLARMRGGKT